jgi:predicted AAA+ superfamily ATPase
MDRNLQIILLRDNPWLTDPEHLQRWLGERLPEIFYPRLVAERAQPRWHEVGRAHLVIGPRQSGKTTLIWSYLSSRGMPAMMIDCEQQLVRGWCCSAPLFLDDLENLVKQPVILVFDEVQHLDEAGLFFKGLIDRSYGAPILATGSSSYHLGARTRESLAGRATRTRLLPFSLEEVCQDLDSEPELIRSRQIAKRFARHIIVGGYPEVWLSPHPEVLLTDMVEAVILRDASDLHKIRRPDAFRRLLRLAASQAGSLVNLSEWASILGISRDTVSSYLEILEESHIVAVMPPYAGGRRAELTCTPKVYFVDSGIRNQLALDLRPLEDRADLGPLLENWVLTELWKALPDGATLHFWRSSSGAEVDFVVAGGDQLVAVEVKARGLGRPTLPRAARSFIDAYRPSTFLLVNLTLEHQEKVDNTQVQWMTPARVAKVVSRNLLVQ